MNIVCHPVTIILLIAAALIAGFLIKFHYVDPLRDMRRQERWRELGRSRKRAKEVMLDLLPKEQQTLEARLSIDYLFDILLPYEEA